MPSESASRSDQSELPDRPELSDQQRRILHYLWRRARRIRAGNAGSTRGLETWGVKWPVRGGTPAERASRSRSLRRLEERGLVLRQNATSGKPGREPGEPAVRHSKDEPHNRTTHVKLTSKGQTLCQRLFGTEDSGPEETGTDK